jgi:3-oxoacyl-(acyl-carrier-protein) synthase
VTSEVVVTGLGLVSPIGNNVAAFEAALLAGRANAVPIEIFDATRYRTRIAQTVCRELRGPGDPAVAFALRAAEEALSQAGLDTTARRSCGLAMATTATGWVAGQRLHDAFCRDDHVSFDALVEKPDELFKEAVVQTVASRFGLQGPSALLSPACAAASSAIAWAAQRVRDGDTDVMLAGASDALTEVVYAGFHAMRLLAEDACRPFSAGRRGLVLSEGAAFLVLEEETHARERSATILARLRGWGLSCDAVHPTTPDSGGILRAMTGALVDAGLHSDEVDQVSAHGTGSAANDAAEAEAIASLLGDRIGEVPVSAIKGTLGHTEGAAGAFGALAAVLSLQHDTLPPLAGYTKADPTLPPLRLVTNEAEHYEGRNILVNASGFGGANASLVFEKPASLPPRRTREETPVHQAVVTSIVASSQRDGTLTEPDKPAFWPGGRSLRLDRVSSLVMSAAQRLLGPGAGGEIDPTAAVVLGTTYGSQARHESMWSALAEGGPRDVDPNDFALSTFNAPGSAVASSYGFGGANLVFLGATGGAAAIDEATRLVASGRAKRVLAGGYSEVTPYFRRVLAGLGEWNADEAVALAIVEDEASARERGKIGPATILGYASGAPATAWPAATELLTSIRSALRQAAIQPGDLGAIILDPHANTREAQLAAIEALFGDNTTLIDLAPLYGNCLAASTPLALNATTEAAASGSWPAEAVIRGNGSFSTGRPVLINACGLMSGCAALVVMANGSD